MNLPPADGSYVATNGDALVAGANGNEETPDWDSALADCHIQSMRLSTAQNWTSILAGFDGRLGTGSLLCRGIYNGFFGSALIFAAKSIQHTVNHL